MKYRPVKKPWWIYVHVVDQIRSGSKAWNIPFYVQIHRRWYGEDGLRSWVLQEELFESRFWVLNMWRIPAYLLFPSKWCALECRARALQILAQIAWNPDFIITEQHILRQDVGHLDAHLTAFLAGEARGMLQHGRYWYFRRAGWDERMVVGHLRSELTRWYWLRSR